ncbi:hypothetical protein [Acinetobacter guerrae]|uniref:hypothetical protein n=1 Tax=Acinetobacter guerrae TaxID=1843371 RepID=UPI00125F8C9B|nr:hypothetical protein [Acinetobacter guerrae]
MNNRKNIYLGLFLFALILGCLVYMLYFFATWFGTLNPSVGAALVTASLGLLGLWYAQWQSKSRDIAESHRSSKIEVYNLFFEIVEAFQNEDIDPDELSSNFKKKFQQLNKGLILWASPEVIRAYLNFRRVADSGSNNILFAVDQVYQAIRKDLSNSNYTLQQGDLIRLNLKGPDELK